MSRASGREYTQKQSGGGNHRLRTSLGSAGRAWEEYATPSSEIDAQRRRQAMLAPYLFEALLVRSCTNASRHLTTLYRPTVKTKKKPGEVENDGKPSKNHKKGVLPLESLQVRRWGGRVACPPNQRSSSSPGGVRRRYAKQQR